MYTAKVAPNVGNLGFPAILVAIVSTMVKDRWTDAQISSALAEQYDEYLRVSEAELTEAAIYLGQNTDRPYWVWFNTLRSARDMALYSGGETPGNGAPPPPKPPETTTATWIAIGGAALVILIALKR